MSRLQLDGVPIQRIHAVLHVDINVWLIISVRLPSPHQSVSIVHESSIY